MWAIYVTATIIYSFGTAWWVVARMLGIDLRILGSIVVLLLTMALLLTGPTQAAVVQNWAMVTFRDSLIFADGLERGTDTLAAFSFDKVLDPTILKPAVDALQGAVARSSMRRSAAWNLGRMQMAVGDLYSAQQTLAPLHVYSAQNPLLYGDILMTDWGLHDYQAILAFYEQIPIPQPTDGISETIAAAYFRVGGSDAPARILELRPSDLWAIYERWLQARQTGDIEGTEQYTSALSRFSIDAIAPGNDIRLDAALQTMPKLFDHGVWDLHTLRSVVGYLVWKNPERPGVEDLLKTLSAQYPDSEVWPLYMGELYQRKGDLDAAAAMYVYAQSLNPQSTVMASRFNWLASAACAKKGDLCDDLSELALSDDENYVASDSDADLGFVADALGMDAQQLQIGPNLIDNGDFDRWQGNIPESWRFETYSGSDPENAVYVTGEDIGLSNSPSIRIQALRGGRLSDETMTLAEYLGPQFVADGSHYLVRITYRADEFTEGSPLILLGDYSHVDGDILLLETLPLTQTAKSTVRFLTTASTPGTSLLPVIRNWGNGQLWIDSIEIRPVYVARTATQ